MSSPKVQRTIPITLAIVGGIIVTGFASKLDDPLASVSSSKSYQSPALGSIDLQGACSVTPDVISCWNADGVADSTLTEKIKAFYIVESSNELRYKFGRKNRLVVFKRPPQSYGGPEYVSNVMTPSGGYLGSAGQIGMNGGGRDPFLEWYAIDSAPTDTTTSVVFNINIGIGSVKVPLREGAEGQTGTMKVHINSIKPGPDRQVWIGGSNHKQRAWTVSVAISGFPGAIQPNMIGNILDLNGAPVNRVDDSGNPLSDKPTRNGASTVYLPPAGFDASLQILAGAGTTTQELSLTVNPAKASAISFNPAGLRKVTITDIPLDPK